VHKGFEESTCVHIKSADYLPY